MDTSSPAIRAGEERGGTDMALSMDVRTVDAHVTTQATTAPERLESILDRTAQQVAESGTAEVGMILRLLSETTRHLAPGAAAALVDRDGSEVARQRAFGIVHGVVLRELDADGRTRLLDQLTSARPARPVRR
jgi:hypothetical protein